MRISDWSSYVCASELADDLRGCVETHRLRVEQGAGVGGRFIALEPRRHPGQQGETGGVRFGKTVAGKALDLLENPLGVLGAIAALGHAGEQALAMVFQAAAALPRSEEHTSELQSLMRISYAVFCLKKKK